MSPSIDPWQCVLCFKFEAVLFGLIVFLRAHNLLNNCCIWYFIPKFKFLNLLMLSKGSSHSKPVSKRFSSISSKVSNRTLYIILPYSNPSNFKRREALLKQTIDGLRLLPQGTDKVQIVVTQLVYSNKSKIKIDPKGPYDLTLNTSRRNILWSKENLINLAIHNILKKTGNTAKYFAFVDADITFLSPTIVKDTLNILEKGNIMVQMFQEARIDEANPITVKSFAYQYEKNGGHSYKSVVNTDPEYWHPGFAWAMDSFAFNACGGLIDRTLGSADRHMAMALICKSNLSVPEDLNDEYLDMILDWQARVIKNGVSFRSVPGKIIHHYHGDLRNRKYVERWEILKKNNFSPRKHITENGDGLLVWSDNVNNELINDVQDYFSQRQEDAPKPKTHNTTESVSFEYQNHQIHHATESSFGHNPFGNDDRRTHNATESSFGYNPGENAPFGNHDHQIHSATESSFGVAAVFSFPSLYAGGL
ncbi:hypothetical protein HK096_004263 [Nowakowskiella sp. JEL0078]|nr:hypothetical protein HK096_004263 [Nowakowskiella sp. JEL0078]